MSEEHPQSQQSQQDSNLLSLLVDNPSSLSNSQSMLLDTYQQTENKPILIQIQEQEEQSKHHSMQVTKNNTNYEDILANLLSQPIFQKQDHNQNQNQNRNEETKLLIEDSKIQSLSSSVEILEKKEFVGKNVVDVGMDDVGMDDVDNVGKNELRSHSSGEQLYLPPTLLSFSEMPTNQLDKLDVQEIAPIRQNQEQHNPQQHTITIPHSHSSKQRYSINIISQNPSRSQSQTLKIQYKEVLDKIDKLSEANNTEQLQKLIFTYIETQIHPCGKNQLGDLLIKNGKFIVHFIGIAHQKFEQASSNFLQSYLYEHFSSQEPIENDILYFQEHRDKFLRDQLLKSQKTVTAIPQLEKVYIKYSEQEFRPHVNYSIVADKGSEQSHSQPIIQNLSNIEDLNASNQAKVMGNNQLKRDIDIQVQSQQLEKEQKAQMKKNKRKYATKPKLIFHKNSKKKRTVKKSETSLKKSSKKDSNSKNKDLHSAGKSPGDLQSQLSEETHTKLGSYYHFRLGVDKKHHQRRLSQVRASARLSKSKGQRLSRKSYNEKKNSKSKKKKSERKNNKNIKQNQSDQQYIPSNAHSKTQNFDDDDSIEEIVAVDWVKEHLPQIQVNHAVQYTEFKAMTKNDKQIAQFLLSLERKQKQQEQSLMTNSHQVSQITKNDLREMMSNAIEEQSNDGNANLSKQKQSYKQYSIQELPLTIEQVIDPNINNHNIYALLKLSRLSGIELGTRFVMTRLTRAEMVNRRYVLTDIEKAKELVGSTEADNLGYIQLNQDILKMIQKKRKLIELQ